MNRGVWWTNPNFPVFDWPIRWREIARRGCSFGNGEQCPNEKKERNHGRVIGLKKIGVGSPPLRFPDPLPAFGIFTRYL